MDTLTNGVFATIGEAGAFLEKQGDGFSASFTTISLAYAKTAYNQQINMCKDIILSAQNVSIPSRCLGTAELLKRRT